MEPTGGCVVAWLGGSYRNGIDSVSDCFQRNHTMVVTMLTKATPPESDFDSNEFSLSHSTFLGNQGTQALEAAGGHFADCRLMSETG